MRGVWMLVVAAACRIGFDATDATDAADAISCDPAPCGSFGGICEGTTCVIERQGERRAECPPGMPCRIECTGPDRPCRDGVSCGGATSCELWCIGYRACQRGASCGTAPICTVICDGEEACESGIDTAEGTSCTAHCCGIEACADGTGSCVRDAVCR